MSEFDQLQAFISTVEEGSISAVARKLGKAQSAISTQIANLEIDLNLTLFDRNGYRPELTEDGKSLYAFAQNIMQNRQAFHNQVDLLNSGVEPRFSLYVENGLMVDKIYQLLMRVAEKFPNLELVIEQRRRDLCISALQNLEADAAFITKSEEYVAQFKHLGIGYQRVVMACHPKHALAQKDVVEELELANHRSTGEHPHLRFKKDRKIHTPFYWQCSDLDQRIGLIKHGLAFGLLPIRTIEKELKTGELTIIKTAFSQNDWLKTVGLLAHQKSNANQVFQFILSEVEDWDQNIWVG